MVTVRLEEIGVVAATSSDPNFAANMLRNSKVSDVVEDVMVQMIPDQNEMDVQPMGDGPVEPPGDDTQTGSDPLYSLQWDKKRMRASN